jgi:hypothetical protein
MPLFRSAQSIITPLSLLVVVVVMSAPLAGEVLKGKGGGRSLPFLSLFPFVVCLLFYALRLRSAAPPFPASRDFPRKGGQI